MAISTILTFTDTGGAWVLDTEQDDYEFKRAIMEPLGNLGAKLHPGENTARVQNIVQLSYPNLTLQFSALDVAAANAEQILRRNELLDKAVIYDYGTVTTSIALDMSTGTSLDQRVTLSDDIPADAITLVLPAGRRPVTLEVVQDADGSHNIDTGAWPSTVNWGSKGAPGFGESPFGRRFLVFKCNPTEALGHYDTNVF